MLQQHCQSVAFLQSLEHPRYPNVPRYHLISLPGRCRLLYNQCVSQGFRGLITCHTQGARPAPRAPETPEQLQRRLEAERLQAERLEAQRLEAARREEARRRREAERRERVRRLAGPGPGMPPQVFGAAAFAEPQARPRLPGTVAPRRTREGGVGGAAPGLAAAAFKDVVGSHTLHLCKCAAGCA